MKVEDQALVEALARHQDAIVAEWLARTLKSYPGPTARFLLNDQDPFRNPVGGALKQGLPVLVEEVLGNMDAARVTPVLDSIVRIRAVQDFTPSQAVAFLFLLKDVLRGQGPVPAEIEQRIDRLALAAFDLYSACREQISEIKVGEARRAVGAVPGAATGVPQRAATARWGRERSVRGELP